MRKFHLRPFSPPFLPPCGDISSLFPTFCLGATHCANRVSPSPLATTTRFAKLWLRHFAVLSTYSRAMPKHSADNPVRIAIIGAGAVSDYHHVPAIRIDPRARLGGVCDA